MKAKNILLLLLIVAVSVSLISLGKWAETVEVSRSLPGLINKNLVYQGLTLLLALLLMLMLFLARKDVFSAYFRKGEISAPIQPEKWIGIQPKPHENWKHFGRNFAGIITLVTAAIIFFQVIRTGTLSWPNWLKYLPFVFLFALVNSFVEELITRFGVGVSLKGQVPDKIIPLVSAVLFGGLHYWGTPGGFFGVMFAGFLGWFLAKSIIETRGIYWA